MINKIEPKSKKMDRIHIINKIQTKPGLDRINMINKIEPKSKIMDRIHKINKIQSKPRMDRIYEITRVHRTDSLVLVQFRSNPVNPVNPVYLIFITGNGQDLQD